VPSYIKTQQYSCKLAADIITGQGITSMIFYFKLEILHICVLEVHTVLVT